MTKPNEPGVASPVLQVSNGSGPETTDDDFLGGRLKILQPARGYRAGLDAVFLAAAAPVEVGRQQRVIDIGAGVGTVGLAIARRIGDADVTLLEREPDLSALAAQNIARNNLMERVRVVAGDVLEPADHLEAQGVMADSFDHAVANPPYHASGRGTRSGNDLKARSHAMDEADLEGWARLFARVVRPSGTATMILPAPALPRLLAALNGRFGGIKLLPVHSRPGLSAHRVLVQGIKGSRADLELLSGFVVHDDDGHGFTPAAKAILRSGVGLTALCV